eukprot:5277094-Lingulodinium_polyedra.AAC.1
MNPNREWAWAGEARFRRCVGAARGSAYPRVARPRQETSVDMIWRWPRPGGFPVGEYCEVSARLLRE